MRDNGTESTHLQLYHSTQIGGTLNDTMVMLVSYSIKQNIFSDFLKMIFAAKSVKLNNRVVRQIKSVRCDVIIFNQITRKI